VNHISPDKVRAEINRFWLILSGKSQDRLEELYSSDAIVFTGKSRRPEPAMLAIARRSRRAPASKSNAKAEVGAVELQISRDVAVASYTYQYQEERNDGDGGRSQRNTLYGRATQVFQADSKGTIKIVHEHLSAAVPPDQGGGSGKESRA
jgi:ketosteroid isomerase-like protein